MKYKEFEHQLAGTLQSQTIALDTQALLGKVLGNKPKKRRFGWLYWLVGLIGASIIGLLVFQKQDKTIDTIASVGSKSEILQQNVQDDASSHTNQQMVHEKERPINGGSIISSQSGLPSIASSTMEMDDNKNIEKKGYVKNQGLFKMTHNENKSSLQSSELATADANILKDDVEIAKKQEAMRNTVLPSMIETIYGNPLTNKKRLELGNKIECPDFGVGNKWLWQIIPEVGYFIPLKTLDNASNESNQIFDLRKGNEKSLEGLHAALYVQARKQNFPLYFKAGLHYSTLTERMAINYSYTKMDTTQGIISITVSQSGDTITAIFGDIVTEKTITGKKVAHHSFSLFDLPIAVGIEKNLGSWKVGAELGAFINISQSAKGVILESDTSFQQINTNPYTFKNNIGLSYFGGVWIGKDFERIGRFYLGLRYRYIPSTFSDASNPISQKYNFIGANLGYIYNF